jgi:hypothetical protein
METDPKTAALVAETDPAQQPPIIEFPLTVDGQEEIRVVPCPTPMRAWLWILENLLPLTFDTTKTFDSGKLATEIAARAIDVLPLAVDVRPALLRAIPADVLDPVLDKLAAQLWGELRNAAPFSEATLVQATVVWNRKMAMLLGSRAAGTAQPTPSSPSSDAPGEK